MQIKENTQMVNRNRLHIDRVGIFGGYRIQKAENVVYFSGQKMFFFCQTLEYRRQHSYVGI